MWIRWIRIRIRKTAYKVVPRLCRAYNCIISGLERGAEHEYGHHLLPLHRRRVLRLPQIRQDIPSLTH